MFTLPFLLAAGSLPLISGAPIASSLYSKSAHVVQVRPSPSLSERSTGLYEAVFGGDGLVSDGWPSLLEWVTEFDELFEANKAVMSDSCSQWGVENNSDEENDNIKKAIQAVSSSSGVDSRFILAIVMQESNGCVRVQTTDNGVVNPGLMQSHDGTGSCNKDGTVQTPCPYSEIHQMIVDGVEGTSEGDGLKQLVAQNGGDSDATSYYKAARCYNSGSIASDGNLGQGIATHCYVSDIANRLLGWTTGTSNCDTNTIGSLESSSWSGSSSSGSGSSSASPSPSATAAPTTSAAPEPTAASTTTPEATPIATPTSTAEPSPAQPTSTSVPVVPTPVPTTTVPSASPSASASSFPIYPYATSSCTEYASIVAGDYCEKVESQYGITASELRSWNTGLDEPCSNLWKGYRYCVKA